MSEILIDSSRFKHNLNLITNHLKLIHDETKNINIVNKIALVLKDNAYGHGLEQIAELAKKYGIRHVFVKNLREAEILQGFGFESVCILYLNEADLNTKIASNVSIAINDARILESLAKGSRVELKVNSGMNRNGINPCELESYLAKIKERRLTLYGIFTHNGYGDDVGDDFAKCEENFYLIRENAKILCKKLGLPTPRFHCKNTSSLLRSKTMEDDIVRIGIGAYGYLESEVVSFDFLPIMSLYADRISTKLLKKGDKIGYSGKSVLKQDQKVSTYDIGYGDGFFRIDESKDLTSADGHKILPRTSMDCFSCISEQDRICVFDDVRYFAKAFNTITYEILTHLSPFIKRTII